MAADWLGTAVRGHCGITLPGSDCDDALSGSFPLNASTVKQGWPAATEECLGRCRRCANCEFITVSLAFKDCSWYRACDTSLVKPEAPFRSGAVTKARTVRALRVALVFFGKHGQEDHPHNGGGRSQNMNPDDVASPHLIRPSW